MRIRLPKDNLGCFSVTISKRYWIYFDVFATPYRGMFVRVWTHAWYISRRGIKHKYIG